MITPVATVADALFAFIMSLLRDPDAVEEFDANPQAALNSHGLGDACAADVRAVKPVVVDHPSVAARTVQTQQQTHPTGTPFSADPDPQAEVIREITRIVNQFTIDARTTIVDQSTNQNIWTNGGDVTQIFDQDSVVASGDDAIAAGHDATTIDSDVDITVGDVSVGNTTNDGSYNTDSSDHSQINDSFNGTDVDTTTISINDADDADADADSATLAATDEPSDDDAADAALAAGGAVTTAVDAAVDAATSAAASAIDTVEPADLSADLTDTDTTYETDAASVVLEEPMMDDMAEEQ